MAATSGPASWVKAARELSRWIEFKRRFADITEHQRDPR
jgi:hypothetical protein